MNLKKIFSVIVFVLGLAMLWGSYYIKTQVASGKLQVSSAERSLSQGKSLFSINPITKQIGEGISKSADRKISNAKEEISSYENLAQILQIGGIVLVVLGFGLFLFSRRR